MPSTRNPSVVNPGPGKLPIGVVTASALLFQSSSAGATAPLFSPKAIPIHQDFTAGGGGDASKILTAVGTAWLWMGDSLTILEPDLFLVCDQNDHPLWVGSTLIKVSSIAGAAVGDDFVAGPITLTFNVTIPAATNYRIYYGVRGDLATAPTDVWSEKIIRNSAQGAAYLYVDPVNLTTTTLGNITTKTGGVGNTVSNAEQAFENIDSRLTKLRSFVATVTDNSASFGGDHNTAIIDDIVSSGLSTLGGGTFIFRPGIYLITNAAASWDVVTTFNVTGTYAFLVADASRTTDCQIASASIVGPAIISSANTLYKFEAIGNFDWDGQTSGILTAGSLVLSGSVPANILRLRSIQGFVNTTITNANACLEVLGSGVVELSNIVFDSTSFPTASTPLAMLYIHNTDEDAVIEISDCTFTNTGTIADVDGLRLDNCNSQVKFTNCQFLLTTNSTGNSWALNALNCTGIVFENCLFQNDTGQTVKAVNSGITFINCLFAGGIGGFGTLANPQLLAGEGNTTTSGFDHTLRFIDCKVYFGTDNVKPTGAPTKPIIELGGHDSAAVAGEVEVQGLYIQADPGLNVHNFTTVVFHDHASNKSPNRYDDVTINMNGSVPTNSGTISQFGTGVFLGGLGGHILEIVGVQNYVPVSNLSLIGLGVPTVSVPRGILCTSVVDIKNVIFDAFAAIGAGFYSGPVFQPLGTNVYALRAWPAGVELAATSFLRIATAAAPGTFTNCVMGFGSNTVDGWAARIENTAVATFNNCEFLSQVGQALRAVNAGVTFNSCVFESGTSTALTNPQLICGEGFSSLGIPLTFNNCVAIINSANVRTGVSTPTKAIIELGGHDNAAAVGSVRVDGLDIAVSSGLGVHNYSTVLLHGHASNTTLNTFNDVTIDMKANDPGAPAGNKTFFASYGVRGAPVLEVVGAGTSSNRVQMRNLQIVNVGAPTAAVSRAVLQGDCATIDGLVIDGTGAAAGSYSEVIEVFSAFDIFDLQMFPTNALKSINSGTQANFIFGSFGCRVIGLKYHHHSVWDYTSGNADACWFKLNNDGVISDAIIYIDQSVRSGGLSLASIIRLGNRCQLSDSQVIVSGTITSGTTLQGFVSDGGSNIVTVSNCVFRWNNVLANQLQAANFTGDFTTLVGNQFLTTSAAVVDTPTYAYAGTTFNDLSIASINAPNIAPTVY